MRFQALSSILLTAALLLASGAAYAGLASRVHGQTNSSAVFAETFDGAPASPQPWSSPNWDISVHTRGARLTFDPMQAQHGPDCSAPPASHAISALSEAVYNCRDHLMTAINAGDYGVIYLTPNHAVDFSAGEAVVRFDMSTLRTSGRDWVDLWISPYESHLQLPLDDWLPDLGGEPRQAIHIKMGEFNSKPTFSAAVVRGHTSTQLPGNSTISYESFLTPSPARRDTFELRISRTSLKFGMPQYNFWWVDTPIDDLGWSRGIVQFGHHSYTPTKCEPACTPNTWHWDNVQISPAVPFTMLQGDRRYIDTTTGGEVQFAHPAPAGARLRFSAVGGNIQVSFDGGVTWRSAARQRAERASVEIFKPYWTPVPEGTSRVLIRGQDRDGWYQGPWMARDISIWHMEGVPAGLDEILTNQVYAPLVIK